MGDPADRDPPGFDPSGFDPSGFDPWDFLRRATDARVALGRVGNSLPTSRLLEFQQAQAQARDAVHAALDVAAIRDALAEFSPLVVESRAGDRGTFLQRPDLGRRLADSSRATLQRCQADVAIVLADGLSASAVQRHGTSLWRLLHVANFAQLAPPVIATQARVALGDEIAEALGVRLVVMLIGERPGLSASDSLGAYVTYAPKPGVTRDADRNCLSNIRPGGLPVEDAAHRLTALIAMARHLRLTGTALKEDVALAAAFQG